VTQTNFAYLAFDGFEYRSAAVEKLFYGAIAWYAAQGLTPDHVELLGKGYRQEYLTLDKALAKVKKQGFDTVWSVEINILSPDTSKFFREWSHSISYHKGPDRNQARAAFRPMEKGLADPAIGTLAAVFIEALAPEYGIGEDHTGHTGMALPDDPVSGQPIEWIDSNWQSRGAPARIWRKGVLRGVLPHNYLPAPVLTARIAGTTLEKWIRADRKRGTLAALDGGLTLWQAPPAQKDMIFLALWQAGLIYDEARHVQRKESPPRQSVSKAAAKSADKKPQTAPVVQGSIKGHKTKLKKRNRLIAKLEDHDSGAAPVLDADKYFDGNWDEFSLAPNGAGSGRPPIADCAALLLAIAARDEVQSVLVLITEMPDPEEDDDELWLSSDTVFILTSATLAEVRKWAKPLYPDEISLLGKTWPDAPPGAPELAPGMKVYSLWWD